MKRKGQFVALDAKTGVIRWETGPRKGDYASILLTPRHLVFLTNEAKQFVARRAAGDFELERQYDVANSETWAVPVLLGRDLLLRNATALIRLVGR